MMDSDLDSCTGYSHTTAAPNVLRIVPPVIFGLDPITTIVVLGSFNIRDSSSKMASQLFLDPEMNACTS
jgi:hypothetical protein